MTAAAKTLSRDELNRALLARQGLLEPFSTSLTDTVERIGAIQAQYWPAVAGAVFSRMGGITLDDVYKAFESRELVAGSLIRGTIHVVSGAEHPAYSAVAELTGANTAWHTASGASPGMATLRSAACEFAATQPRDTKEFAAFAEEWLAGHPDAITGAAIEYHRGLGWRRVHHNSALIRMPANGDWTAANGPKTYLTSPLPMAADAGAALALVIRRHLGAFGPAAVEDLATWIGTRVPATRAAVEALGDELVTYQDEAGRVLYDLHGQPLPDARTAAPPRLLPKFDSTLLAHAVKHRTRIIAAEHREAVYFGKNLQLLPTYLIDGYVAGTWAVESRKKLATVTLTPLVPLKAADRKKLVTEAERMAALLCPGSAAHEVVVTD